MSIVQLPSSSLYRSTWVSQQTLSTRAIRRSYAWGSGSNQWQTQSSAMRTTWLIIGLNAAVFGAWQYAITRRDRKLLRSLHENATCSWDNIRAGRYWTLITSAFSHQGLVHFAFNMIAFYAFGTIMSVVPGVGGVHIVSLSIGSAIAGSSFWLYHQQSSSPQNSNRRWGPHATHVREFASALGASGMVVGAGAAATCLMPFAPMLIMGIVPMPLWVATGLYVLLDAYYLDSGSRVGHAAHLGGSIFGALYYSVYLRRYGGIWGMVRRRFGR